MEGFFIIWNAKYECFLVVLAYYMSNGPGTIFLN